MPERILPLALLALALCPPAQAQELTVWSFSDTGFERNGVFDPHYRVGGAFVGSDLDNDGHIEQAELSRFSWDQYLYDPLDMGECGGGGIRCSVENFSYSPDGRLAFHFEWQYSDEMAYATGTVVAGESISRYAYASGGVAESGTWRWTGQTRFQISPPPVPEPGRYAMLLAGLLAALGWRSTGPRALLRRAG